MNDQNNAPERIWLRVTDKTVMARKPSDADEYDVEYIRADRAAPTGSTGLMHRHTDKRRNVIINRCSTDLETIINGHDPEIGNLNNDVWDRLDKMAVEIEAALASREAQPAAQEPVAQRCAECDCENGGKECTWIKWTKPDPASQQEAATVAEAALTDLHYLANELSWDRRTRDISDRIIAALRALKGDQK